MLLRAIEGHRRDLGDEHPATLTSLNNLASSYSGLGRLDEAESLHQEALETRRRVLGDDHPDTNSSRFNLALLSATRSGRDQTIHWLREAVDHGFADMDLAAAPELVALHGDPEFEAIVAEVRRRNEEQTDAAE